MSISKEDRICLECGKLFEVLSSEVKRGSGKYCSRKCFYLYQPKLLADKFDGMEMTYTGVHNWVKRVKGMPSLCEDCGTTEAKAYDWANISGEYKRLLSDWKRLCRSCHMKFDNHPITRKKTLKEKYGRISTVDNDKVTGRFISGTLDNTVK